MEKTLTARFLEACGSFASATFGIFQGLGQQTTRLLGHSVIDAVELIEDLGGFHFVAFFDHLWLPQAFKDDVSTAKDETRFLLSGMAE